MDPGRAARLRDNKRRFRSRRKEYVTDLERSLRELREQGVQATIEVQLSARRVARENVRLRQLLRYFGVDENVVHSWIQQDENDINETVVCSKRPQEESAQITFSKSDGKKQDNTNGTSADNLPSPQPAIPKPDLKEAESAAQCLASMSCLPSKRHHRTSPDKACISETSSTTQQTRIEETSSTTPLAPCKLITHLAANPHADITQMPTAIDGRDEVDGVDGVQCSRAYQMLMQFATTEEKIDTIALALESGCVANKGPGGGCKVQNKFLWKALDDIQS
ncbi:hypothetical protein DL95DRAFT_522669 [Leptodontidium sp. 2 PMI_412]|nr:hypothetical protein DL95DRAFT_522669 [Leptodontidium sp. 2 PMI_412]